MPVKKIILTDSTIGSVVENDNEQKAQYLTAINSLINSSEFPRGNSVAINYTRCYLLAF